MKWPFVRMIFIFLSAIQTTPSWGAEKLVVHSFGNKTNPAIIFIHGGPDSDSSLFQASAAEALSGRGFYVVTYDQRGQGRSAKGVPIKMLNFENYVEDLKEIIEGQGLHKLFLVGHSFGGLLAIKFSDRYPSLVSKVILVSTPLKMTNVFSDIGANCRKIAEREKIFSTTSESIQNDLKGLNRGLGHRTIVEYIHDIFRRAFECGNGGGLYMPHPISQEAAKIYERAFKGEKPTSPDAKVALDGFVLNERFQAMDVTDLVRKEPKRYRAIFGDQDGLFSAETLSAIRKEIPDMVVIPGAGHNVFADQENLFIQQVVNDLR